MDVVEQQQFLSGNPDKQIADLPGRVRALARRLPRRYAGTVARAEALASLVDALHADAETVAGALLYPLLREGAVGEREAEVACGAAPLRLARELVRLGEFGLPVDWRPESGLAGGQAEVLRKMLLAVVADIRVVPIRLAEQVDRLRRLKRAPVREQRRAAVEAQQIYAPLASRLGIWQIKWELEDLAFRFLEPETYRTLAAALRERREDRENYIHRMTTLLERALGEAGLQALVSGRPKHIYSIWRKMQRKGVELGELFDVRAVRILVETVADCYAALGVVHNRWPYIPGEFDDYIATPKDNAYRSLHTAVIGPGGRPLEIQIRTHEMHAHAELGIAAHWRYKEGASRNPAFERKINWLRRILEPERGESDGDFIDRVKSELFEDRVYALSPKGEVVDLPTGATPLDFAYYVHTEIGHHCRGAKVNGRMVPLTYKIANGDRIEIITARNVQPSRDWLIPQQGYLASARSRAKVRSWFRRQNQAQNRKQGRLMLDRELARLGVRDAPLEGLQRALDLTSSEQLYERLGSGDLSLAAVAAALHGMLPQTPAAAQRPATRPARPRSGKLTAVEGVGDLLSNFARCCRPVPPEPITGYITQGRGVSIHRADCANLLRLAERNGERVLSVDWSEAPCQTFPVEIRIEAYDRRGLVRDVSALLADRKLSIAAMNSRSYPSTNTADIDLTVNVSGLDQLSEILNRLAGLPNVISARRREGG